MVGFILYREHGFPLFKVKKRLKIENIHNTMFVIKIDFGYRKERIWLTSSIFLTGGFLLF